MRVIMGNPVPPVRFLPLQREALLLARPFAAVPVHARQLGCTGAVTLPPGLVAAGASR